MAELVPTIYAYLMNTILESGCVYLDEGLQVVCVVRHGVRIIRNSIDTDPNSCYWEPFVIGVDVYAYDSCHISLWKFGLEGR